MSTQFRTGYFDGALTGGLGDIIKQAKRRLADVDFDTIVGTGFSGGVVIPSLALAMGKKFVLIRKETDDSHHGQGRLLGELGDRWLFVDDFVSSGATRRRVVEKIAAACVVEDASTTFVGQYMYVNYSDEGPTFEPFEHNWIAEEQF